MLTAEFGRVSLVLTALGADAEFFVSHIAF